MTFHDQQFRCLKHSDWNGWSRTLFYKIFGVGYFVTKSLIFSFFFSQNTECLTFSDRILISDQLLIAGYFWRILLFFEPEFVVWHDVWQFLMEKLFDIYYFLAKIFIFKTWFFKKIQWLKLSDQILVGAHFMSNILCLTFIYRKKTSTRHPCIGQILQVWHFLIKNFNNWNCLLWSKVCSFSNKNFKF